MHIINKNICNIDNFSYFIRSCGIHFSRVAPRVIYHPAHMLNSNNFLDLCDYAGYNFILFIFKLIKNMPLIFCFKCKTKTNTNGLIEKISKNGRNMICGICEICGTNKTMFASLNKIAGCIPACAERKQDLMYT